MHFSSHVYHETLLSIENIKKYIVAELKQFEKGNNMITPESVADNVFHLISKEHNITLKPTENNND